MPSLRTTLLMIGALSIIATTASAGPRFLRPLGKYSGGGPLVVQKVFDGTPAAASGILVGDTLLQGNELWLGSSRDLRLAFDVPKKGDSSEVLVGRAEGRIAVRVLPDKRTRRIGIEYTGVVLTDSAAQFIAPHFRVAFSVVETAPGSYVRVDVVNESGGTMNFGPDSVLVIAGDGQVLTPISPQDFLALKFGGTVSDVAGQTYDSMGDAIASGIMSGWARGTRETYTRSVLENAMRETRVPSGSRYGGAIFYAKARIPTPVRVRLSFGGANYEAEFGTPSK